ncbi:hypothetical protein JT359_07680 [Candidatus Poribacteria bacterium]|nr:hypothetical protein [Candidatus Poribacteria bacterium]
MNENPLTTSGTHLFLDDELISSKQNVIRTIHECKKHPIPVLEPDPDNPWEHGGPDQSRRVHLYGTTMYDEVYGKYRMWYMCRMGPHWRFEANEIPGLYVPRPGRNPSTYRGKTHDSYGRKFVENDRGDLTCYAESDDGLIWKKPNLGIFEFNGNPNNNIVWDLHGACVFRDDKESDIQKRYKMIGFCRRYRNVYLLTSPDGIRWDDSNYLEPVAERNNEGGFNVVYDKSTSLFRAYCLTRDKDKDARRMIDYTESQSLEGPWKPLEPMFRATELDDEIGSSRYNPDRAEIHNMSGFLYHNQYVGIAGVLYVTGPGAAEHEIPVDGPIDAQLVCSRDGFNWDYPDDIRTPIIPRGGDDAFDRGMVMGTATQPIITENEIHWYYTGTEHTHGAMMKDRHKAIGLAKWRLDGFASMDANQKTGIIETITIDLPVKTLEINGDASNGEIGVEVLSEDGKVQQGFSIDDCLSLTDDEIHHQVKWKNVSITQATQPLRLRFILNNASLYSFRLRDLPNTS